MLCSAPCIIGGGTRFLLSQSLPGWLCSLDCGHFCQICRRWPYFRHSEMGAVTVPFYRWRSWGRGLAHLSTSPVYVCVGGLHLYVCMSAKLLQFCLTLCDPVDCSLPGSSVHEILQTRYWSGFPCPLLGGLLDSGIKPMSLRSPALAGGFFTTSAIWEALCMWYANSPFLFYYYHYYYLYIFCCCCSAAEFCPTLCDLIDCSPPGLPVLHYLPEFAQIMSTESVMPLNHLICHPLLQYFFFIIIYFDIQLGPDLLDSLVAQTVKNLPAMQEIRLQSLGWEDPLEEEMATHSSILA